MPGQLAALLLPIGSGRSDREGIVAMFAIIAAVLFAIAFIIHVTSTTTNVIFDPLSLSLVALALLSLHLAGVGSNLSVGRRR
jgi:predicted Co/Zn/Cd cation transporter (cation efflux family)